MPATTLLGSENLLIEANSNSVQSVTSTPDDTAVVPVTVSTPANVDLQISGTAPASATLGSEVPLSWTVTNAGGGPASAAWTDAVYASPSSTFNSATAVLVATSPALSTLAAGASYTQAESVSLPAAALGDGYLLFVANNDAAQAETNTANDAFPLAISLQAPSLAVTSVTAPTTANLGDTVPVSWTVTNNGAVSTVAGWTDAVYLSDSPTLDGSSTLVGNFAAPVNSGLAASASYTQNEQVTLPYAMTGSDYLVVVADSNGSQPLTTGSATVSNAAAINVSAPDLAIAASAPSSAVLDEPFNVSWTVTNSGSVAANASWEDAVFVSNSSTFDPQAATPLTTVDAPSALAAGASYTSNATVTITHNLPAGQYYLYFVADRNNDQGQSNEADKVYQVPLTVSGPALSVNIDSAPASAVAGSGTELGVSWTVTNDSSSDAMGTWHDNVYLSTQPTLNLAAPGTYWSLASAAAPLAGPLPSQSSYTQSLNVAIPSVPTAGTYYLVVEASADGGQAETDTSLSEASSSIVLSLPAVNLEVTSANVSSATVVAGSSVALNYTVTNQGTAATSTTWNDDVYLSNSPTLNASSMLMTSASPTTPIAAGETYNESVNVSVPSTLNGPEYLLIVPDSGETQGESEPSAVDALPITVTLPAVALATAITAAPSTAESGSPISVSWSVTNEGTATTSAVQWQDVVYLSTSATNISAATELTNFYPGTSAYGETQLPLRPAAATRRLQPRRCRPAWRQERITWWFKLTAATVRPKPPVLQAWRLCRWSSMAQRMST